MNTESSTDLLSWADKTNALAGVNGVMSQALMVSAPHEFFRVRLTP